ncbi:hypothetical protein GWI33_017080 [Rhynchophorus ferrugineus]|uniref:Uncharacterized protein n=1 Tax=Rhynchophorus ferrugineus TaxID=354439 RepID=A0A834I2L2_RHYFE|nr:hypothetical protein GWI33_017080 [Rhynchophorus ferrugineus]
MDIRMKYVVIFQIGGFEALSGSREALFGRGGDKFGVCIEQKQPQSYITSSQKNKWRRQPRTSNAATPSRRFNVTVVQSGGGSGGTGDHHLPPQTCVSPAPRHRNQHFASIPEDQALDDPPSTTVDNVNNESSRGASPAPSWDFSQDDSDSVSSDFL